MKKKLTAIIFTTLLLGTLFVSNVSAAEYEVVKGDTLWSIAVNNDTTVDQLMDINDLRTTLIKPKQILKLAEVYEVKNGDTLESIAAQFDATASDLKDWNQLGDSTSIQPGQTLYVYPVSEDAREETQTASQPTTASQQSEKPAGQTLTVTATAYTAECHGCSGITYTGVNLNQDRHAKVIAVDPSVIPLGSKVYVEGYGHATAEDIGGAIKGNKIDLHVPTKTDAYNWGVRTVEVTILD